MYTYMCHTYCTIHFLLLQHVHECMLLVYVHVHVCTVFPQIEARASISFQALFDPASKRGRPLYVRRPHSGFFEFFFYAVYSSKLESDIVVLLFGQNGEQCSYGPGLELNFLVFTRIRTWLTISEWVGPGVNSRPSLYFLKGTINPRPLNRTGFYSEEASIRGNTVYVCEVIHLHIAHQIVAFSLNGKDQVKFDLDSATLHHRPYHIVLRTSKFCSACVVSILPCLPIT